MVSQEVINRINSYSTHQNQWERLASIRTRPRRLLESSDQSGSMNYYPLARQPLCVHPEVERLGTAARDYILIQSFYKYMNDIANIEKDVINKVAYKITKNQYFIKFSHAIKQDALSIIIDESYHAFVAMDFMHQVAEHTKVEPIQLPVETELSCAIDDLKSTLPECFHEHFEFITVCIAEHALTHDLISTSKSKDVSKSFYYIMHDHVLDEGRHAIFFSELLTIFWAALADEDKNVIGSILPELLRRYLQPDLQRKFDEKVLKQLEISPDTITKILDDTHIPIPLFQQKTSNVVLRQMLALLRKANIFEHIKTNEAFSAVGLI